MEQNNDVINELIFLRQMVHRLNSALSKYQGTDDPNNPRTQNSKEVESIVDLPAPWLTNPKLLSPLIFEYETHMSALASQVAMLQKENHSASEKLQTLNEENERLHAEMKIIVESKLQEIDCDESGTSENVLLKNMQAQLELAYNEKDAAVEMNKETMKLLDRVRHEKLADVAFARSRERLLNETKARNNQLENDNLQMQALIETMQRENKAFSATTTQQLEEIKAFQDQIRDLKKQVRDYIEQESQNQNTIASLNNKLYDIEKEKSDLQRDSQLLLTQNQQLECSLANAENRLAAALQAESNIQSHVGKLNIQVSTLEKNQAEIEAKEIQHLLKIRESAQMLDDALLVRDSALIREKQKQEDLDKTTAAMEVLVKEVADSVKKEVDKANAVSNAKLQYLYDEITTMEMEIANLKSEANRAKREKRKVEEELSMLVKHRKADSVQPSMEEFQRRTINAERARDDALINIQSLQDRIKQMKLEHEDRRLQMAAANQTLEQRVKQLVSEAEEREHERLHLLETANQCKHDLQKLEMEARTARLNAMKEFTVAKDVLVREKKQLEVRLSSADEIKWSSVRQLHKLLSDQQRVNARWKEETKTSVEQYESKIKDLQAQLSQNKQKCRDLVNKLRVSVQDSRDVDSRLPQLEDSNWKLRSELRTTQAKLLDATQRLGEVQTFRTSLTLQDL